MNATPVKHQLFNPLISGKKIETVLPNRICKPPFAIDFKVFKAFNHVPTLLNLYDGVLVPSLPLP